MIDAETSFGHQVTKEWIKDRLAIEEAVAEVSRLFLSPEDTDLKEVLSIIGKAASVNRTYIVQIFDDDGQMVYAFEWCDLFTPSLKDKRRELDSSLCPWLIKRLKQGENVMIPDLDSEPSMFDSVRKMLKSSLIRSLLIIPIYSISKDLTGFLGLENSNAPHEWLGEEVQTFRVLAEMVSTHWERMAAMKALEKSEKKYRALYKETKKTEEVYRSLLRSSAAAIITCDLLNRTRYVSPSFSKLFGWTAEEVKKIEIPFIPEEEREAHRALMNTVVQEGSSFQDFETKRMTKDGRLLDISISISRYDDHEGKPSGILYILKDLSERKKLEAQLIQAQKMEAIGNLAGGIAHDFNNNLQAIFGCTEILLLGKDKSHPDYSKLLTIEKAAQRASNLTKRLLIFGREMENSFEPVDLNHEILQVSEILERTIPKMINIEMKLEKDIHKINADSGQLEQILMNLGVNARDAMPNGGTLTFKTEFKELDHNFCNTHPGSSPGKYILLSVSDNGIGIGEEILDHIFEPFFTTKRKGEGTGLGLAMVYGIVKGHNGYITCDSQVGKGTVFNIYFPVLGYASTKIKDKKTEIYLQGNNEKILLVDDEKTNRELGKEILSGFNYQVMTASDGDSALYYYCKNMGNIDLVILDLIMPGKGGLDTLSELLKVDPSVKVVIASGYAANESAREATELGAKNFIMKPYEIKEMLKVVRNILGKAENL